MANVIKIKRSATASATPNSLEYGELGLNYADGKIYYKNTSSSIVELTSAPGVVIQATAPTNKNIIWADTSVTGSGVLPTGGTTGQMLAKSSSTDYATAWTTPVTSSDLALKANLASPTFTGTVTIPAGASISGFATLASPTFTGTVTLPSDTSIGSVSATEVGYLDGVTSAIQTQINTKASTGKAIAMAIVFGG